MNSLDLYEFEVNKSPTPTPESAAAASSASGAGGAATAAEPSLNEEVNQALGQLGRFWGGFRASSQSAFNIARKDFSQVVQQARTEIGKIATEVTVATSTPAAPAESEPAAAMDVDGAEAAGQGSKSKGKEKDPSEFPSGTAPESNERPSIPTGLFARLQSRMPPNLQPSAIASAFSAASASLTADSNSARSPSSGPTAPVVDLAALRSTLISNIQRAQDNLPLAQAEKLAEGYLAKSQELFKEAGDFFKEAVKVVPPSERELDSDATGVFVSGTDVWLFPSPLGTAGWGGSSEAAASPVAGTDTPQSRPSLSAGTAAFTGHMSQATRSEALLRRLKYDPEMIRLDPSLDAAISSLYSEFVEDISQNMGGIGGDKMTMRISEVLKPGAGGELDADAKALIDTRDTLVPAEMSNDTFWLRYFFRVRQITSEEEKRKALLANVTKGDAEEDFSWEDDEDEAEPAAATPGPKTQPAIDEAAEVSHDSAQHLAPAISSPRPSDDGSYDVVGEESAAGTRTQSPVASAPPSSTAAPTSAAEKPKEKADDDDDDDDDDDSDWE